MKSSYRKARAIKALNKVEIGKHAYIVIKTYKDGEGYFYDLVGIDENINDYIFYNPNSSYDVDEVYNLSLDINMQLEETRSYHTEKYNKNNLNYLSILLNKDTSSNNIDNLCDEDITELINLIDKSIYKGAIIFKDKDEKKHIYFIKKCDLSYSAISNELKSKGYEIIKSYNFEYLDREKKVLEFATKKHEGQFRKSNNGEMIDYINHPIMVSILIKKYFPNNPNLNDMICASYLHDTLEDTETTFEELASNFGYKIAYLVKELTSDKFLQDSIGKSIYLSNKLSNMTELAQNIKLCDRLSNVMDLRITDDDFKNRYINETLFIIKGFIAEEKRSEEQIRICEDIEDEINKQIKKADIKILQYK